MQNYTIKEKFIAAAGQQTFKLNYPFIQGSINVYVNGGLQSLGSSGDYVTLPDSGKIIFNRTTLKAGDEVAVLTNNFYDHVKVLGYGKRDTENSIFKRYGSEEKLKFNDRYKVNLRINNNDINWSFSTQLTPFFTTVKKIREDLGRTINELTDEYIASLIHRNSWELVYKIQEAMDDTEASEDLNENAEIVVESDNINGEYKNSWRIASNWVRFKTEIDIIMIKYYQASFDYGTKVKTTGDLSVTNSTKLPYIDNLLDKLKKDFEEMDDKIFGATMFAASFQKGSTNYNYDDTVGRKISWEG